MILYHFLTYASFKGAKEQQMSNNYAQGITIQCSGKQMSNNYAPCFNRIDFVVIPSYKELPCYSLE